MSGLGGVVAHKAAEGILLASGSHNELFVISARRPPSGEDIHIHNETGAVLWRVAASGSAEHSAENKGLAGSSVRQYFNSTCIEKMHTQ